MRLLRPHEGELEMYARRMTGSAEFARDALQNAVMRAFKRFDRYDPEASFRSWMFRILTNEIYALLRRRRKIDGHEVSVGDATEDHLSPVDESTPLWHGDEDRLYEWLEDEVVEALRRLGEQERAMLLLRGVAGLKYREIAETLEIPIGSVMGGLARARQKVRDRMNQHLNERSATQ